MNSVYFSKCFKCSLRFLVPAGTQIRKVSQGEASVQVLSCQHLGASIGEQARNKDASWVGKERSGPECESKLESSQNAEGQVRETELSEQVQRVGIRNKTKKRGKSRATNSAEWEPNGSKAGRGTPVRPQPLVQGSGSLSWIRRQARLSSAQAMG